MLLIGNIVLCLFVNPRRTCTVRVIHLSLPIYNQCLSFQCPTDGNYGFLVGFSPLDFQAMALSQCANEFELTVKGFRAIPRLTSMATT